MLAYVNSNKDVTVELYIYVQSLPSTNLDWTYIFLTIKLIMPI
jgi:hypothetical protein